jgi:hypothetical protein
MPDTTTRLGAAKPLNGETDWGTTLRSGLDTIDAGVALLAHAHAATYAALAHTHGAVTLPWADVTDAAYGAVGDGTNDDTAEIQAAIDAVGENGVVVFPVGRYKVSSTLVVANDNVMLLGMGCGEEIGNTQTGTGTRIEAATGLTGAVIRYQRVANDRPVLGGVVRDLTIDGNSIGSGVDGLHFRSDRGLVDNVYVVDCTGDGIWVEGYAGWATYDTRIRHCQVGRCDAAGLYTSTRGEDLHVTNCIFFANQDGARIAAASQQITGCHFYDNTRYGIFFDAGGTRSKVANCKIEGNKGGGARLQTTSGNGMSDIQFTGNNFANNWDATTNVISDIYIGGDAATGASRTMIVGNNFSNKGGGGAAVKGKHAIELANNAAQTTTIVGNCFARASSSLHYGTGHIGNSGNTAQYLKAYVRANQGESDNNSGFVQTGTATIANGATSATVTHGLDQTPVAADISVTLTENPTNTPGAIWVDTIGATTFAVNCENDPGASGLDFSWRAVL